MGDERVIAGARKDAKNNEPLILNSHEPSLAHQEQAAYRSLKVCAVAGLRESVATGERSLHAIVPFQPGDVVVRFRAKEYLPEPNRYTVQTTGKEHMVLDPEYLQYINHSCEPNVFFDIPGMSITCISPISVDDEITFFYPSTEWSMAHGFYCKCGSPVCLGYIRGALYVAPETLRRYRLSEFIEKTNFDCSDRKPTLRHEHLSRE